MNRRSMAYLSIVEAASKHARKIATKDESNIPALFSSRGECMNIRLPCTLTQRTRRKCKEEKGSRGREGKRKRRKIAIKAEPNAYVTSQRTCGRFNNWTGSLVKYRTSVFSLNVRMKSYWNVWKFVRQWQRKYHKFLTQSLLSLVREIVRQRPFNIFFVFDATM